MKYYSRASYNHATHEDGSRVAHKIELACSTRKLTVVSHASSDQVTQQKCKNMPVLLHAGVNLDVSGTVSYHSHYSKYTGHETHNIKPLAIFITKLNGLL